MECHNSALKYEHFFFGKAASATRVGGFLRSTQKTKTPIVLFGTMQPKNKNP
jgi:hypothetical protein